MRILCPAVRCGAARKGSGAHKFFRQTMGVFREA